MSIPRSKKLSLLIIILGTLALLFGIIWWYIARGAYGRTQTELSTRSQEFIQEQRALSGSEWKNISLGTPVPMAGDVGTRFSTACFTVSVPYVVRDQKIENATGSCTFAARILSPPARLVIWARPLRGPFDEDTAITLRRSKTDMYTEKNISSQKTKNAKLFQSEDELALFFSSKSTLYSFAFTNVVASKLQENDLQALLDGFIITSPTSKE